MHVGIAVLFVGVAASSAFQDARDVELQVGPDRARSAATTSSTCAPTGDLDAASNGALEKIDLGAELRVRRDGERSATLRTERSFFPSTDPTLGALSRYFEGEATSEVGLRAGLRRDFWSAVSPNVATCASRSRRATAVFKGAKSLPAEQREIALAAGARRPDALVRGAPADRPTFRLIVSPLVTWIWIGALIVFAGGLIALWPPLRRAPRPVAARYAARVARELGRA